MMRKVTATIASLVLLITLAGCATGNTSVTTVTVRLWDTQVAAAYEKSFSQFEKENPTIRVKVVTIPYTDYFTRLRTDLASGTIDDIFWTNAANFIDYEKAGLLVDVGASIGADERSSWTNQVVRQYTAGGHLWGVPQLTDPGIGLIYNKDLLQRAGIADSEIGNLTWDPSKPTDSLRATLKRLTVDTSGRTALDAGFDPTRVASWGYSASNDLNAMLLQYLGSNGATWQTGDRFTFDSAAGRGAIQYLVDLINVDHVAPPASQTNPPVGADAALQLFLQGKIAVLQTGAYNLANVEQGASFDWGVAGLPSGPAGAISVTNGVIAAGYAKTHHSASQLAVLKWMGSKAGSEFIGRSGTALPAVASAQNSFFAYWSDRGVDVTPLMKVLDNGYVQPPQGASYSKAQDAYQPLFNEMFLGSISVRSALAEAEAAANSATESSP